MSCFMGCFGWRPAKMPRANEQNTVIWLATLKILMIIPVAVAAFKAKDSYEFVKRHPELQASPPYDSHVLLSQLLVYVGSMSMFPWLFISCFLLSMWRGPWILLYGLVDLGLAVTIAVGVGMEARYLPASARGCNNAVDWQTDGTYKSFFLQAAEVESKKSARGHCKNFVTVWSLATSVLFFQMVISYVGIFFDERQHSLLNPFRPLSYFVISIISPPFYFHIHIVPRIRFAYHSARKFFRRIRGQAKLVFEEPIEYVPQYESIHVQNPTLQEVLTIEHVLLDLVNYLHYEDIINLSLSSKAIREAVFPGHDLEYRVPKLKDSCCENDSKTICLYCNKKICNGCKIEMFQQGLPGARHVKFCQPYCRQCYFKQFSRHQRGYKRPCRCHTSDRNFGIQRVCRTCSRKEISEMQLVRTKRYQQEARDIAKGKFLKPGEITQCRNCKRDLKSGTRWWVCGKCKGECRDVIHPPYIGKRKEVDVEKAAAQVLLVEQKETARSWWSAMFGMK
ncbi:hypothetical protein CC78DRAFT_262477 [Lojkania enalia]|uniref:F-box domain-containing protein n=1 Tax=Lojkania enalia TaxID=147567 RepID=A0A9P4K8S4_9PLEO|nr:hypothetical protein CC78DRAFT_262477 [Didymosphaeria enalia]